MVKNGSKIRSDVLLVDSGSGILHRHHDAAGLVPLRSHPQHACAAVHGCHRVEGIHDQIQDHLLQLDAIRRHRRELLQLGPDRNPAIVQFAANQRQHLAHDIVDVDGEPFPGRSS